MITDSSTRSRKATRGAFIGFLVDNFDIYLPLVALAPAMIYFIPADLNAAQATVIGSWVFAATLVGRPLGAFIFGCLADTIGRRKSTLIAVAGFGTATLVMAVLPGYQTWGIGSVIALTVLRFVAGVLLGGEYTGANVLAMEESPRERRGLNGGIVQTGATLAYVVLTLLTLALLAFIPSGGVDSPYTQWGWRIPFVIGAFIAFAFLIYYAREVEESSVWESKQTTETAAARKWDAGTLKNFLQVFLMMTGMWFLLNSVTAMMPPILTKRLHLTAYETTLIVLGVFLALTFVYIGGGALSQRIGRRTYLIGTAAIALIGGIASYTVLIRMSTPTVWAAMIPAVIGGVCVVAPWAVVTSYLSERFKTSNRAVGFGLGYSLAVIIPAFFATYQLWLSDFMPAQYTVLVLIAVGSALTGLGAALGPETKNIDFHSVEPDRQPPTVSAGRSVAFEADPDRAQPSPDRSMQPVVGRARSDA